ncbi:hypothetical protein Ancab_008152 [Ancistrocladus abbreviatus]
MRLEEREKEKRGWERLTCLQHTWTPPAKVAMALCEEGGDIAIAEGGGGRQLAVEERGYSGGVGGYGSHFRVTARARAAYSGACAGLYGNNARYHSYARQ